VVSKFKSHFLHTVDLRTETRIQLFFKQNSSINATTYSYLFLSKHELH
jgi:hypothetical protein